MVKKIGIDVGSRFIRVVIPGETPIFIEEPTVAAINESGKVVAVGNEAIALDAEAPGTLKLERLLFNSVRQPDIKLATAIFSAILRKNKLKGANVYFSMSIGYSKEIEETIVEAIQKAGARDVFAVSATYAAAMGCKVKEAGDSLIVNIGYENVDMAAYSNGQEVSHTSCDFGGSEFEKAIITHCMKKHQVKISSGEADKIKREIGTMTPSEGVLSEAVVIRRLVGLPKKLSLTAEEITSAMEGVFGELSDSILTAIRELDSEPNKVILTGGGSLLRGLASALEPLLCIPVKVAPEPQLAVIRGLLALSRREVNQEDD